MDVAQGDNAISGKSGSDSDEDIRPVNVRCAENEEKTKVIRKHLGRRGRPPAQRELRGEKRKRSNSKQPTTQHSIKSIQCGRVRCLIRLIEFFYQLLFFAFYFKQISRIAPVKTDFKTEAEALSWLLVNLEKLLLKAVPSVDSMGLKIVRNWYLFRIGSQNNFGYSFQKSEMIPVKIVNVSEQLNNSITGPDIEVVAEICKIKRGGDSVLKRLLKEKRKVSETNVSDA